MGVTLEIPESKTESDLFRSLINLYPAGHLFHFKLFFFSVCVHRAGVVVVQRLGLGYCSVGTARMSQGCLVVLQVMVF